MASPPVRLAFSHAGQDFIVKARSTADGWEIRGFPQARGTGRTRFATVVPHNAIQDAKGRGATDPIGAALRSVRDAIIRAIDHGEPLKDEAGS